MKPKLEDLLETLNSHSWEHICPTCKKDCSTVALVRLVYVFTTCKCKEAPFTHLVETVYHRECFKKEGDQ